MSVFLSCVTGTVLKKCIEYSIWGANSNYLFKLVENDTILFKVGEEVRAMAKVSGKAYLSNEVIWGNGLFWCRIPITFDIVLDEGKSINFKNEFKDLFVKTYGNNYGYVFINKLPIESAIADMIVSRMKAYATT